MKMAWVAFLLALATATATHAATWHVMRDGSGDFTTIQPAVEAAASGDTILIGPGRYAEMTQFSSSGAWWTDVCIGVSVDSLTLRGVDRNSVIIGPSSSSFHDFGPVGLMTRDDFGKVTIENMTFEHVYNGIYATIAADVVKCTLRNCDGGITSFSSRPVRIAQCSFQDNTDGINSISPANTIVVDDCDFVNNTTGTNFVQTLNGEIVNCRFEGGIVGAEFEQEGAAQLHSCTFRDIFNVAIAVTIRTRLNAWDNLVSGGQVHLMSDSHGRVTGTANRFLGGSWATVLLDGGYADLHGNHILRGGRYSVEVASFVNPPDTTVDLSNNWWGTTDADSLAAWIWDGHDDPKIHAFVQFQPFSSVPLSTEKKSLGGVKGLYR